MFAILKHFAPKKVNFPEGMGGFSSYLENPEGRGGVTVFLKKWKIWGGELPAVVGVLIFSGTTHYKTKAGICI